MVQQIQRLEAMDIGNKAKENAAEAYGRLQILLQAVMSR